MGLQKKSNLKFARQTKATGRTERWKLLATLYTGMAN
jgi:hypothetical protein